MPVIKQEPSLSGMPDHLKSLSESGDPLAVLERAVDFEQFRGLLEVALAYSDGSKGGRPHFDPVAMFPVTMF